MEWLKNVTAIFIPFLTGGTMGAIINNLWINHRNKIPTIGIQQSISRVFIPEIFLKSKITFRTESKEYSYENLHIIEAQVQNKGNTDYANFDLSLTLLPEFADVVYLECKGQDISHEATLKEKVEFESPSKTACLFLNPFNRENIFHITLYATCKGNQRLTKGDIEYSSKTSADFKDVGVITKPIFYQ